MAPVETVRAAPAPTAVPAQVVRQRRPVAKAPAQAPSRVANFQAIPTAPEVQRPRPQASGPADPVCPSCSTTTSCPSQ